MGGDGGRSEGEESKLLSALFGSAGGGVWVYNHNMVNSVRAVILWEEAVSLCRSFCWYK